MLLLHVIPWLPIKCYRDQKKGKKAIYIYIYSLLYYYVRNLKADHACSYFNGTYIAIKPLTICMQELNPAITSGLKRAGILLNVWP